MGRHVKVGTAANFLGTPEVDVVACCGHTNEAQTITVPPTVCMQAGSGPVRLQFDMTADGARALADLLVIAANQLDQLTEGA